MSETIIRVHEVSERTGLSISTIKRLVRAGIMPAPVQLSERALGWRESVINDWIIERPTAATPHTVPAA